MGVPGLDCRFVFRRIVRHHTDGITINGIGYILGRCHSIGCRSNCSCLIADTRAKFSGSHIHLHCSIACGVILRNHRLSICAIRISYRLRRRQSWPSRLCLPNLCRKVPPAADLGLEGIQLAFVDSICIILTLGYAGNLLTACINAIRGELRPAGNG